MSAADERPDSCPCAAAGAAAVGSQLEREWLTTADLASELQVPIATVRKWRDQGTGPPGHRIGKYVRYRRRDIDTWAETRRDPAGGR